MEKKKSTDISVKNCVIMTNLTHIDLEKMKEVFERKCIEKWAYIIHDKDVYNENDVEKNNAKPVDKRNKNCVVGAKKQEHIHIVLKFKDTQKIKYIAKWFNLPENFIEKIKGSWITCVRYLTHLNDDTKYQYEHTEVKSNFDFVKETTITESKGLSIKKIREKEIIELINSEVVREYNKHQYISAEEFHIHNRAIKNTFSYVSDRLKNQTGDRNMRVIYINGESGAGKTTYAKQMAEEKGFSYYVSSSSNDVLDSYEGQDCLILDDLRASSLAFPDLLKLLDNHTNSSVKSRFKNKHLVYCKMIIITSTLSIDMFFNSLAENENEDITQLKRRVEMLFELRRFDMDVKKYNKIKKDYSYIYKSLDNPTIEYLRAKNEKEKEETEELVDFFGLDKLKKFESEDNNMRKIFAV